MILKTKWDYTELASSYLKRPDYAPGAVEQILTRSGISQGDPCCDIGAGVAHLTLHLARHGLDVTAVEPNDAMRALGRERTKDFANVAWVEGTSEQTGQLFDRFRLVTFGSSFNVIDRAAGLRETARILAPGGWFACIWNHRDLEDPIQKELEAIIRRHLPEYGYGVRREDQSQVINGSGLFEVCEEIVATVVHKLSVKDCKEAWDSHATLQRQAGPKLPAVLADMNAYLDGLGVEEIAIPYATRGWMARLK